MGKLIKWAGIFFLIVVLWPILSWLIMIAAFLMFFPMLQSISRRSERNRKRPRYYRPIS